MNRVTFGVGASLILVIGIVTAEDRVGHGPLLFSADFEDGKADRFEPTDATAWKIDAKDGNQFYSLTKKRSNFEPPVRSPYNRALVKEITELW